jgi:C4-dicarboxylate transporter DctM subunit
MTAILFISGFFLIGLGIPIAMAIGIAGLLAVVGSGGATPLMVVPMRLFNGLDSFPLMAIPFFILAAEVMTRGALADVLLRFAAQFVGRMRGGVGHTGIFMLTAFSGISGAAVADAAGPGTIVIRMMERAGYTPAYAAALVASTSIIGPIIPPSIVMIIYALADDQVSVIGLFLAGIFPGLLIAGAMFTVNYVVSRRRNYRGEGKVPGIREIIVNTWRAIPALLLPVIILGGIHGGFFTPTEASAVAVFYALAVGILVYRTIALKMIPGLLFRAALMSSVVMMVIAMSRVFAFVLTINQIPQSVSLMITSLDLQPIALLLMLNAFLLVVGMFLDPVSGVIVLVPILAPLVTAVGIDPTHFAIVAIVNLTLGLITPPVGGLIFITSVASRQPVTRVIAELWPFGLAMIVVLLILIFFPSISIGLPRLLGY